MKENILRRGRALNCSIRTLTGMSKVRFAVMALQYYVQTAGYIPGRGHRVVEKIPAVKCRGIIFRTRGDRCDPEFTRARAIFWPRVTHATSARVGSGIHFMLVWLIAVANAYFLRRGVPQSLSIIGGGRHGFQHGNALSGQRRRVSCMYAGEINCSPLENLVVPCIGALH